MILLQADEFRLDADERKLVKAVASQLDLNRDGIVTKDEFVDSCLENGDFMQLVNCFKGETVWGDLLIGLSGGGGEQQESRGSSNSLN
jgi:hypothetical protein